jgi:hypothetical protein
MTTGVYTGVGVGVGVGVDVGVPVTTQAVVVAASSDKHGSVSSGAATHGAPPATAGVVTVNVRVCTPLSTTSATLPLTSVTSSTQLTEHDVQFENTPTQSPGCGQT